MLARSLSDSELAARASAGDGPAFAELAHRYRGLIAQTIRGHASGLTHEDQRQEALIGLYLACRTHDPAHGRFGGIATVCVRRQVWHARLKARARKHRVLTEALGLDYREENELTLADTLEGRPGDDPARVVELRDELRRRAASARVEREFRSLGRRRRLYSEADVATALALVAAGRSLRAAGRAVGGFAHDGCAVGARRGVMEPGSLPDGPSQACLGAMRLRRLRAGRRW